YNLLSAVLQINAVQASFHQQIKLAVLIYVRENRDIFFQILSAHRTGQENLFIYSIALRVIIIYTDAQISLVISALHISVNYKIITSGHLHPDDLNLVCRIFIALIALSLIAEATEAETLNRLIRAAFVHPEISRLHKRHDISSG